MHNITLLMSPGIVIVTVMYDITIFLFLLSLINNKIK